MRSSSELPIRACPRVVREPWSTLGDGGRNEERREWEWHRSCSRPGNEICAASAPPAPSREERRDRASQRLEREAAHAVRSFPIHRAVHPHHAAVLLLVGSRAAARSLASRFRTPSIMSGVGASGEDVDLWLGQPNTTATSDSADGVRRADGENLSRAGQRAPDGSFRSLAAALRFSADTELFLDVQLKSGGQSGAASSRKRGDRKRRGPADAHFSNLVRIASLCCVVVRAFLCFAEWVVAETVEVKGRWILVEFQSVPVAPEWINVDQDTERLAELYSRSGAEAQAREAQQVAMRMERQSSGGAGAAAAAGSSVAAAAGQPALPAASAHLLSLASAQNQFDAKTAREAYTEVLTRCEKEIQTMLDTHEDRWLQRLAEERLSGTANGSTKTITKSQSCFTPTAASSLTAAAAAASSSAAAASSSSAMDDVSAPDSLSVSALIVRFPLFDSMSRSRMVVPVRSEACGHPEAFDLWTHICHRIESSNHALHPNPLWTCPLCKKEAWAADLHVDPLLMHVLQCIQDGRMDSHFKQHPQEVLTPASALMSSAALQATLANFASLIASPPAWGASSCSEFEERRLALSIGGAGRVTLTLDDASRAEARKRMNRARTMPTPTAAEKRKSGVLEDAFEPGGSPAPAASAATSSNGSAAKKPRTSFESSPFELGSDDERMDAANGSAAAAAAASSSSSSSAAAAAASCSSSSASASAFSSLCPWPSWTDDSGCFWIDVREGPSDIEDPARWAAIKVKMEKAHQVYAAIQKQQQDMCAPPPMPVTVAPMPMPMPINMAQMHPAQLAQLSAALQAQGMSAAEAFSASYNRVAATARASSAQPTYPGGAPPFHRASTLPSAAAASASPPLKRRKKPQRAESSVVPKGGKQPPPAAAAGAAASKHAPVLNRQASSSSSSPVVPSSSAAAASPSVPAVGHAIPLVNVNTCSVWDLQQVAGVGPKIAARIVQAREQKWFLKKIKWNDRIIEQRNKDKSEAKGGGAGTAAAAAAGSSSLPPAASAAAASASSVPSSSSECECEAAEWCSHVKAFKSLKSLKDIEGVGSKMFNKFQAALTV